MKNPLIYLVLLLAFFISLGCAQHMVFPKPVTIDRTTEETQTVVPKGAALPEKTGPDYEPLQAPAYKKTEPPKTLPPRAVIDPKQIKMFPGPVMINVENMPLSDFIVYALGDMLKISFVMDEKAMKNKKPISMRMPQPMPSDKTLELLIGVFEKNKLYLEEKAGALYILNEPPPESKQLFDIRIGRDTGDSSAYILQAVPLRHVKPNDILPLVKEILKTDIQVQTSSRENVLLIYGQASKVRQVVAIVDTFDVPYLQGKNIFLLRLTYWQSDEFIKELTKILKGLGFNIANTSNDPGPLFVPIKQLNCILVAAPDDVTAKYILEWRDKLDTPEAAGDADTAFSYHPKYTRASDLVESIKKLYAFTPAATTTPGATTTHAPAPTTTPPPEARPTGSRSTAQRGAATAALTSAQILGIPGLKMSADDSKNIIIIISSASTYKVILSLIEGLDTPARQVLIEATIAELTLTDELKYGLEWYITNTLQGGTYQVGTLGALGVTPLGLSFQFLSQTGNIKGIVTALATANKANILSTPRLTVLDNKEAMIQIGQDVPTVTSQVSGADITSTSANPSVLQNVQYRTTGVILKVRPTINSGGLLTLDISQEVSQPGATGVGGSPIILTRVINTSVVVAHGQTLALGGLMRETESVAENKVPLLGDIPLIGNLFKYTDKTKDKTELLVLVTPTILVSTDDATKITDELKKELKWIK